MSLLEIYTDGGASPNPGKGGWGAVLLKDSKKVKDFYGGELETSNNRMELTAVIKGLEAVDKQEHVTVYTDSNYVKLGITTWIHSWKKNGWKTAAKKPVKNQDLWRELDEVASYRVIEWQWVKGHSGDKWNEYVDALVHKARQELK